MSLSGESVLRPLRKLDDDAIRITDKRDPVQHLGMDRKTRPFLDFYTRRFQPGEGFFDVFEMEGYVLDAGRPILKVDSSCGTARRRKNLQHATAGVEKGDLHAVRHLLAQMQFQAEQTAIEFDRTVHIADRHADMFE